MGLKILDDESPMPYGKYAGVKMANVPAPYLLWLYENDRADDSVRRYIFRNLDVLEEEIKRSKK